MTEYMFLYKGGDADWMSKTPAEEIAASMQRWGAWMEALQKKDQLVSGGSPLNYDGKNLTKEGIITDVSTAEVKELVTGYSIVKAATIEAAIEIAKTCPIFEYPGTTVDIREIPKMNK